MRGATLEPRDPTAASLELPRGVSAHVQHDALLVLRADDLDAHRGPWRHEADTTALGIVLDRLGYESAAAQGLRHRRNGGAGDVATITSLAQLRHSGHIAFLWVVPTRTERIRRPGAPPPFIPPPPDPRPAGGLFGVELAEADAAERADALAAAAAAAEAAMWTDVTRHEAVGLLKMGAKKLFLVHPRAGSALTECAPLCCLDFYVLDVMQRTGVGRQLFDAMLEVLGARAEAIAYDRPSPKLRAFLAKHFGLRAEVPQTNNFVVFEPFFRGLVEHGSARRASSEAASVATRPLSARRGPTRARALAQRPF
ncbi:hypothetical protein KFE25_001066 [Diacronema lutheri]|uniref:N-acetyltransferase domain-containing protein n=1 Tax=Diacronema lutheri TaxID=2081491 RepID=A0A8J5XI39_DIALT|nr:hypothetical protein KFE25_001066 [Diacronema lutheri]